MRKHIVLGTLALLMCVGIFSAYAVWSRTASASGTTKATSLPAGNAPSISIAGTDVTVSFAQVSVGASPLGTLTNGGYTVARYSSAGVQQTIAASCNTTITGAAASLSCTESGVPNGDWLYGVTPTLASWSGAESTRVAASINGSTPPAVSSINRAAADPTNASSVSWTVTFSKTVTGVDSTDFSLAQAGVSGASVTGVTGSASTYTVTAGTGSNSGSLGLNLVDNDSIVDSSSNKLGGTGAGNGNFTGQIYSIDKTLPTLSSINRAATSPTNAGPLTWTVTFSEPVNGVTNSNFSLSTSNTGGTAPVISTTSASGGAPSASWTVSVATTGTTGQNNGTIGLSLANTTNIKDVVTNNLSATTPVAGQAYTYDTTVPTVTGVSSTTANGTYSTGTVIPVQVSFSEAVTVTGTPQLALSTGNPATTAVDYSSGSGTNVLTFTYTVAANNASADLDYASTSALALNGGSVKDGATNNATLTLASPGSGGSLGANKAIVISDTTAPTVTGVSSTIADGSYKVSSVIPVTVTFSEPVTVTGTPRLTLSTGSPATTPVNYSSGSTTNTLTFNYTVATGNASSDLDYASTSALALNGGTIKDTVTVPNNATLTLASPGAAGSLGANKDIVIDTAAPTVSGVSSTTADGSYTTGTVIPVTVTFSEPVTVTGTPTLTLSTGSPGNTAVNYSSGSGTNVLTFNYTVAAGNASSSLDYASTSALINGTITDTATNNATRTLASPGAPGSLGANKNIVIDTAAPTVTVVQAAGQADPANGLPINFTVTFSEPVTGFDAADLTRGGTAAGGSVAVTGGSTVYTVAVTNPGSNLTNGTISFTIAASRAQDLAGNSNSASTGADNTITYDTVVPTLSSINRVGTSPTNGSSVSWTVSFSEPVSGLTNSNFSLANSGLTSPSLTSTTATGGAPSATWTVAVNTGSGSGTLGLNLANNTNVKDTANNTLSTTTLVGQVYSVDKASPTVTSISTVGSSPTNGSSVSWTVSLSEPVSGLTNSNFSLANSGLTSPSLTSTTATGGAPSATWTVTASTGSGTGTLGLNLANNTNVKDAANNNLATNTFTGPTYSVDRTAPSVTVNQSAGQADPTNSVPMNFTVTFGEAVSGFDAADVTRAGTATGGSVAVSGGPAVYTIAVSNPANDLTNGTISFTVGAGVAQDAAGNSSTASSSTDNTVTYDTVVPAATDVTLGNNSGQAAQDDTVVIQFTEPMDPSTFCSSWVNGIVSVTGNSTTVTVTNNGSNDTLTVSDSGCTGNGNFGSVALGADYVGATRTFGGSPAGDRSTLAWDPALNQLKITLGKPSATSNINTNVTAGTPVYTPAAGIKDAAGNLLSTGAVTATGTSRF